MKGSDLRNEGESEYNCKALVGTSEGKCVLVAATCDNQLVHICHLALYMLRSEPNMWASMTVLPLAVKHPRLPHLDFWLAKRDLGTDNWQLQSKGFNIDTEGSICIMDVSVSKR